MFHTTDIIIVMFTIQGSEHHTTCSDVYYYATDITTQCAVFSSYLSRLYVFVITVVLYISLLLFITNFHPHTFGMEYYF